ncbi:unnamed protein product [Caenorhabditis bovis]|uniref:Uncharacterized protein n=1 Tax=Caenorhabditis bovis TaxID=2654633 RepID=A0A8S1EV75_9PELO|nr:unnamed protein product [Caenorhabditis bovis]
MPIDVNVLNSNSTINEITSIEAFGISLPTICLVFYHIHVFRQRKDYEEYLLTRGLNKFLLRIAVVVNLARITRIANAIVDNLAIDEKYLYVVVFVYRVPTITIQTIANAGAIFIASPTIPAVLLVLSVQRYTVVSATFKCVSKFRKFVENSRDFWLVAASSLGVLNVLFELLQCGIDNVFGVRHIRGCWIVELFADSHICKNGRLSNYPPIVLIIKRMYFICNLIIPIITLIMFIIVLRKMSKVHAYSGRKKYEEINIVCQSAPILIVPFMQLIIVSTLFSIFHVDSFEFIGIDWCNLDAILAIIPIAYIFGKIDETAMLRRIENQLHTRPITKFLLLVHFAVSLHELIPITIYAFNNVPILVNADVHVVAILLFGSTCVEFAAKLANYFVESPTIPSVLLVFSVQRYIVVSQKKAYHKFGSKFEPR